MTRETTPENIDRTAVNVGVPYMHDNKRWISANAVAAIWNYRARVEYGVEGTNYTRFSVRGRRGEKAGRAQSLLSITIPIGPELWKHFYDEEQAWTIPLAPHANTREINTANLKKDPTSGQFLRKTEN